MGYWQERQEAMYKAGEMQVNKYFTRLEKAFNQTRRELQKTIDAFYFRYAEENGLSFAAAQKKLDAEELGELQDFIDLVMKNIGKYNQQVNNMSIKARITRYQALEAQVDAILRQLYTIDYESEAERTMQEVYGDTYYRTWYNADQYHGFHAEFAQVNPTVVEKLLEYPFNGAAFSDRLWKQKDHLQAQLMEAVTTMLIQGRHPSSLTKEFAKKMNSKKFDAYRLLHTESSFLMSEATHAGYKEDGVPKYEILATLDSKTCNVCGDLDNKVYEVGKEVTGVNMPPFHPLCRCTTVPHYDDTPTEGLTRAARDTDGNPIEVPEDMSWKEWKKKYVDKQEENQKRYANRREERKQQYAKWQEEKNERLAEYSLDEENQKRYEIKAREWKRARFKTGGMNSHEYVQSKRPLANFRALPKEKVVDVLREDSKRWIEKLSEAEKHAIQKYTYNSGDKKPNRFFERLNAMLRGEKPKDEKLEQYSATISKALMKNKLDHDIICYRNMDFNPYKDYPVGKVICAEQFISTSVSKNAALQKKVEMVFFVHKDACGAYIESISKYPKQREFLLDKSCRLRVISNQEGRIILEVL